MDFLAPKAGVAVEVDGRSHDGTFAQDATREAYLSDQGLRVIRVTNDEVIADVNAVVKQIRAAVTPEASGEAAFEESEAS